MRFWDNRLRPAIVLAGQKREVRRSRQDDFTLQGLPPINRRAQCRLTRRRTEQMASLDWTVRALSVDDGPKVWKLIRDAETLDLNSPYTYLMLGKFFAQTCMIAERDDQIAGFVSGFFLPESADTLFIWQIAVQPSQRGNRLGTRLLNALWTAASDRRPVSYLAATVTPNNAASAALFRRFAKARGAKCAVEPCFPLQSFPGLDHEPEYLYRIGPLGECRRPADQ